MVGGGADISVTSSRGRLLKTSDWIEVYEEMSLVLRGK